MSLLRLIFFGLLHILAPIADGLAAELKILTPRSMWTVLNEIGPQFERSSGYKLIVVTDIAATLADRKLPGRDLMFSSARRFKLIV